MGISHAALQFFLCRIGSAFRRCYSAACGIDLTERRCRRTEYREFDFVCNGSRELDAREHGAFLMLLQKAVLFSLEKRELLTAAQRKSGMELLEKQQRRLSRKP